MTSAANSGLPVSGHTPVKSGLTLPCVKTIQKRSIDFSEVRPILSPPLASLSCFMFTNRQACRPRGKEGPTRSSLTNKQVSNWGISSNQGPGLTSARWMSVSLGQRKGKSDIHHSCNFSMLTKPILVLVMSNKLDVPC